MKRRGFLLASAGLIAGCGGGAPSIPRSAPGLKLDIAWPARTRALDAPAGALSAVVTVESVAGGGTSYPAIDRQFTAPGYTQNWTSPTPVATGIVRLVVTFYAERGGRGSVLATAAKTVVIAADGTGAGTIAVEGKVASIEVDGSASVRAGDSVTYSLAAKDAAGNALAIGIGAATFSLESGATVLSLAADGVATALAVGSASLKATLGDKTSAAFAVAITAPSGAKAILASGQTVEAGKTKQLVASVIDAAGNTVAVDPSLVSFAVTAGSDVLDVDNSGNATGKRVGQATVKYTAGEFTATATVSVTADVRVTVEPGQSVRVGESKTLVFTATDLAGNPLSLGTDGVAFALISGGSALQLSTSGAITGLAPGVGVVKATVSGVESAAESVFVGDVVTSGTGLKSIEILEGTGAAAVAGGTVTVHYTGWLLDGTKFDSSVDRGAPAQFSLNNLIEGWKEGIPGMKAGGKRLLVIPSALGYGERGSGSVPPNATLVFQIELISVP